MNIKCTRRQFIKSTAIAGAGMALPLKFWTGNAYAFYQSPGLAKWQTVLRGVGPGAIPVVAPDGAPAPVTGVTHLTLIAQQYTDQLHPALGPTKLWGYQPANPLGGGVQPQKHLGGIIVAHRGTPLQPTFRNKLPNKHILPVDATVPGANQAQNRIATHLHGGLVPWISDGGPFSWFAPNGTHGMSFLNNVVLNPGAALNEAEYYYPNNQSARLMWYHDHAMGITRINAYAGIATGYIIRDDFEAGLIGPAGLPDYIENRVLAGNTPYELPIVFQDKIFVGPNIGALDPTWVAKGLPSTVGSLWYPHVYEKNRWRLLGAARNLPNPSIIPEMFGDTMLVNGTVYPRVAVEPRRYRFRILNACNARFLNLQLYVEDLAANPSGITLSGTAPTNAKGPDFFVIGTEGGFLKNPVLVPSNQPFNPVTLGGSLITGSAERWDVLVDFKGFEGKKIILYNDAPAPFPGGDPRNDYFSGTQSGPDTRCIMRFEVAAAASAPSDAPLAITEATDFTPGIDPFLANIGMTGGQPDGTYTLNTGVTRVRQLTLNEGFDAYGRLVQFLGTNVPTTQAGFGHPYMDPATETPFNGDVEIWEIFNLTGDTHPIHFHLFDVQILNREAFNPATYTGVFVSNPANILGVDKTEVGWKETAKVHPGMLTRVIFKVDLTPTRITGPGPAYTPVNLTAVGGDALGNPPPSPRTGGHEYVWHCHILEHEEHDMMRPLVVT